MVGYRNRRDRDCEGAVSLSGFPMVGYRNEHIRDTEDP